MANPSFDNLYEVGYYKVQITMEDHKKGRLTISHWVQADSSDHAKQQMAQLMGDALVDEPVIVDFSRDRRV